MQLCDYAKYCRAGQSAWVCRVNKILRMKGGSMIMYPSKCRRLAATSLSSVAGIARRCCRFCSGPSPLNDMVRLNLLVKRARLSLSRLQNHSIVSHQLLRGEDRREPQHLTPAVKLVKWTFSLTYCAHEEPQAYLSRVEVEVFGHLLQLEHGLGITWQLQGDCSSQCVVSYLWYIVNSFCKSQLPVNSRRPSVHMKPSTNSRKYQYFCTCYVQPRHHAYYFV